MTAQQLKEKLEYELEQHFSGWDFSHLEGRMEFDSLPWNYENILHTYFADAKTCLDMGTGGGEFLDSFEKLPSETYATEGYEPNIAIAKGRLGKRGIEVRVVSDDNHIPFDSDFFDLIVNRHESYSAAELYRITKPSGYFITQQVGGMNNIDLNARMGAVPPGFYDWNVFKAVDDLMKAGFHIRDYNEHVGYQRFHDIGSIVYYLKCIPWQIPDFTIEKYFKRLQLIDQYIEKNKYIDFIDHRFFVIAQKSA